MPKTYKKFTLGPENTKHTVVNQVILPDNTLVQPDHLRKLVQGYRKSTHMVVVNYNLIREIRAWGREIFGEVTPESVADTGIYGYIFDVPITVSSDAFVNVLYLVEK